MSAKREYSILPQGDRDDFHHHVRDGQSRATPQYICLFTVITVTIVLILAGVVTLTASMFYSDQITTNLGHFWYNVEFSTPNGTTSTTTTGDSSFVGGSWTSVTSVVGGSKNETASVAQHNSSDYRDENGKGLGSHRHRHHLHHNRHESDGNSSDSDGVLGDKYSTSDSDWHYGNATFSGNETSDSDESEYNTMEVTEDEKNIINMEEFKEKFAETMRDLEKRMENMTGIRKAEFVIPIFMLVCFLTLFSIISLCCCVMMKRRDSRRRKLFGKLITDLQTGDSKTVLLNHSDLDD